jgi:hypothetical protein
LCEPVPSKSLPAHTTGNSIRYRPNWFYSFSNIYNNAFKVVATNKFIKEKQ